MLVAGTPLPVNQYADFILVWADEKLSWLRRTEKEIKKTIEYLSLEAIWIERIYLSCFIY